MKPLGVRESAQRLQVHENTLRRWVKMGIVRAIQLPTGVHRFDPEEVERVRSAMYQGLADGSLTASRPVLSGRLEVAGQLLDVAGEPDEVGGATLTGV